MQPIRNQVLVKPFPSDDISEGGIFVPDSAKRHSNKVTVIKTGNGTVAKPMNLKPGDIGYRVYEWGLELMINGELHYMMESDAILAKE